MLEEELEGIYPCYNVDRNVWSLVLKSTMYVNLGIYSPARMSEPLERVELVPL